MDLNRLEFLIVDDDDGDRKLVRRLLTRSGFAGELAEASSVSDALAIGDRDFDVVFLDYYLPGTTGLNHLPELRTRWPRAAIFLMTGQGNETVAKSAILKGATDYVAKSLITRDALATLLATGLESARQKWKIEQQRVDLATFSEVLVHDFKAPVRAAAYLAEQISEDLEAGAFDDVQDGLRLLKKSADQMNAMIHSLSDHIRLDRDMDVHQHTPQALIDGALTALRLVIEETGAKVNVDIENGTREIACSGPQVSQLLQNLIANAIKFAGEKTPEIAVRAVPDGGGVLFEVADNGVGIQPEHVETVFLPFKRAPGAQSVAGTGLGLATCRKIVLRHDGRIWCKSQPGVGTSMFFTLPVERKSLSAEEVAADSDPS